MLCRVVTAFEEAYLTNKTVGELLGVFVEFRPWAHEIVLWAKGPGYEDHFESGEPMGSSATGYVEKHHHTYEVLLCNQKHQGFFKHMDSRNEGVSTYNRGPVVSGPNKLFSIGFCYEREPCCLWPLKNSDFYKKCVSVEALSGARDFLTKIIRPGKIEDLLSANRDLQEIINKKIIEVKNPSGGGPAICFM